MTRARNLPAVLIVAVPTERQESWSWAAVCTRTRVPTSAAGAVPLMVTAPPNRTRSALRWMLRGVWTEFGSDCAASDAMPEKASADAGTASIVVAMITCTERVRRVKLDLKTRTSLNSTGRLRS
jgi:hypothetical protein